MVESLQAATVQSDGSEDSLCPKLSEKPSENQSQIKTQRLKKSEKKALGRQKRIENRKANAQSKRKEQRKIKHEKRLKAVEGMSQDEKDAHFLQIRKEKEEHTRQLLAIKQSETAPKLIIDLAYTQHMGVQEKKSLCAQMTHIVSLLKKCKTKCLYSVHVTNFNDQQTKDIFERNNA